MLPFWYRSERKPGIIHEKCLSGREEKFTWQRIEL